MAVLETCAALTTGAALVSWVFTTVLWLWLRKTEQYADFVPPSVLQSALWSFVNSVLWLIWLCVEGF